MQKEIKRGFSLLELLIVIVLISLTSLLVVGRFKSKDNSNASEIEALKGIINRASKGKKVELLCIDNCINCYLREDNDNLKKTPITLKNLEAYSLNRYNEAELIDFGRFRDKKISLRFHYRANGSTDRLIAHYKNSYYYIPSFFGEVEKFNSLNEAISRWNRDRDIVKDSWNYY